MDYHVHFSKLEISMSVPFLKIGLTDDVLQILGTEPVAMIDKLNTYYDGVVMKGGGSENNFYIQERPHCQSFHAAINTHSRKNKRKFANDFLARICFLYI